MKQNKKFEIMADDNYDNKVEQQHEMNVDDAELLQQQADKKKGLKICYCFGINQKLKN